MTIDYDFEKVYTYSLLNYIGATTESPPIRQALPQPSPSDANAIWLAPNGNDGNAGTEAAPKLTLAGAIAALTAGKPTVHIFRNSYVGDLEFAISGGTTLPIDRDIQCEVGQIAILYTEALGDKLNMFARSAINGIHFEERGGLLTDYMVEVSDTGSAAGNVFAFDNCTFERKVSGNSGDQLIHFSGSANISYEVTACNFIGPYMLVVELASVGGDIIIQQCAFVKPALFVDNTGTDDLEYAILIVYETALTANALFAWSNLLFYGFDNVFNLFPGPGATLEVDQQTVALEGIDITQCTNLAQKFEPSPGTRYAKLTLEKSKPGYATTFVTVTGPGTFPFEVDFTVADNVAGNIPSLYASESAGAIGTSTGFQLQRIGKPLATGGTYAIDSPLIGAGPVSAGTDDIGPWLDDFDSPVVQAWNESFTIQWSAESYSLATRRMNPQSITDVNGNIHTVDDGIRRTFTINFGSRPTYASNNDMRKLVNALADRGSLKFLPLDGDNMFTDSVTADTVDNGDSTMTVTPSLGSGNPMIARNWAGFWATVNGLDFYILSNDATTMVLIDKLGNAFPADGNYSFKVSHILVKSSQADITAVQERFTEFDRGGTWREGADDETICFELQGYSIALDEVEDPEEGT